MQHRIYVNDPQRAAARIFSKDNVLAVTLSTSRTVRWTTSLRPAQRHLPMTASQLWHTMTPLLRRLQATILLVDCIDLLDLLDHGSNHFECKNDEVQARACAADSLLQWCPNGITVHAWADSDFDVPAEYLCDVTVYETVFGDCVKITRNGIWSWCAAPHD